MGEAKGRKIVCGTARRFLDRLDPLTGFGARPTSFAMMNESGTSFDGSNRIHGGRCMRWFASSAR
jgi:hypothetical protein